jgi:acetoacetyl-CoA reductase
LSGRVALVTGASGSIGSAICRELGKAQFDVVANYKDDDAAALRLVEELKQYPIRVLPAKTDITQPARVDELFEKVDEEWGQLDVLINCAGIIRDRSLEKMTMQEWNDVLLTDLGAIFYCTQKSVERMKKRNFGRIVNISSVVALTGNFGQTNYCAAKAGLLGFTRALALETARYDITVNAVCPGFIESKMVGSIPENVRQSLLQKIPKRRFGTPDEVARLVRFLVEEQDYLTGQTIVIDGAWSLA